MQTNPLVLGIDTSCDETSIAVCWGRRVLVNLMASQVDLHRQYGGVYPLEAKRAHQQALEPLLTTALRRLTVILRRLSYPVILPPPSSIRLDNLYNNLPIWSQLSAVAVTRGPGLAPALEVGLAHARQLHQRFGLPLYGINHLAGHLWAPLAQNSVGGGANLFNRLPISQLRFPVLGLLVSGGHTELVLINQWDKYQLLGQTLDDAAGETLDKVARMLGLGYPGGAVIEQLAKQGRPRFDLPIPMARHPGLDFSFSGLKTAVLYQIRAFQNQGKRQLYSGHDPQITQIQWGQLQLPRSFVVDMCASVQQAVIHSLIIKLRRAIKQIQPQAVFLGGGVAANQALRRAVRQLLREFDLALGLPYTTSLYTDNAAMIALVGYLKLRQGHPSDMPEQLDRQPRLNLATSD